MRAKKKHRITGTGMLAAALWLISCGAALAAGSVQVTGAGTAWSDSRSVTLTQMLTRGRILETLDPNFTHDGDQRFTGITLTDLLGLAGLDNSQGLTVIGADQYVGYLPPSRVDQGLLVWESGGQPVSSLKGGPLKLAFPRDAGVHASCYTWYVTALVQGRPRPADLAVVARDEQRTFSFSQLVAMSRPLPDHLVSIAQGCRNEFPELTSDKPAQAVRLSQLAEGLTRAASVELEPYYGPVIRLRPEALAFDAQVIVSCGETSLHPALGGPYSVIFPVEAHSQIQDLVPESGAVFFVKSIRLN